MQKKAEDEQYRQSSRFSANISENGEVRESVESLAVS